VAQTKTNHPELPLIFGEGFLQDHAGHIISEPRIALVELIANAYDAGATRVDVQWPSKLGDEFSIRDNGSGMTRAEFEKRWKTLCYNRLNEQGSAATSPNRAVKNRRAFGRSGKGRHGAFCFADAYEVEAARRVRVFRCELREPTAVWHRFAACPVANQAEKATGQRFEPQLSKT
jgi:histidine kinase/DNA gyrase B/HSP90-like ATPase